MKVGFMAFDSGPCQWYRLLEPARAYPGAELFLAPEGIARPATVEAAGDCDVVQLSWAHTLPELSLMRELRSRGARIALDYDDDPFAMIADYDLAAVVIEACRIASVVTVPTVELAEQFSQHGVRSLAVIPNRIDVEDWTLRPRAQHKTVTIAYAGSATHKADFVSIAPAVWDVLSRHKTARRVILGCGELVIPPQPGWRGIAARVEQRPWVSVASHREAIMALDADIAVAPLRDSAFNRGRSPLKFAQFAALGVPMVASDLPPYSRAIQDGVTGMLATGLESWRDQLEALVACEPLRASIGRAARHEAVARYDLAFDSVVREQLYHSLLAQKEQS